MHTIGNFFFLCLFAVQSCVAASVELVARDTRGNKVSKVCVGHPFSIHVVMHNIDGQKADVSFTHDEIPLHRTSMQMRSVNGAVTSTHIYTARIDQRGRYAIGPAHVTHDGMRYQSNQLRIDAVDDVASIDQKESHDTLFELKTQKETVYVGESVLFTLRFYFRNNTTHIEQLAQPRVTGITQSAIEGPFAGSEELHGVPYDFVEWRWYSSFDRQGRQTIPSYTIEYTDQSTQKRGQGFFSSLFNRFDDRKQIHSNAISCQVLEVPTFDEASGFVGRAHGVVASVDNSSVVVGDAVTYQIILLANKHAQNIPLIPLHNMPENIKCYDSTVKQGFDDTYTKTVFEYVLQPLEAGTFELPVQCFVYFDVDRGEYCEFKTNPIVLTVNPSAVLLPQNDENGVQSNDISGEDIQALCPLFKDGPWVAQPESCMLPWKFFFSVLLSPLIWWCGNSLLFILQRYYARYNTKSDYRKAFKKAFRIIDEIEKTRDLRRLATLFKMLYAVRMHRPPQQVTEQMMIDILQTYSDDKGISAKWERFWYQLTQYAFTVEQADDTIVQSLCTQARQWVTTLGGLL